LKSLISDTIKESLEDLVKEFAKEPC